MPKVSEQKFYGAISKNTEVLDRLLIGMSVKLGRNNLPDNLRIGRFEVLGKNPNVRGRGEFAELGRRYVRVDENQVLFATLCRTWKEETRYCGTVRRAIEHPAYLQIIDLGPKAVRWIISEMSRSEGHWFSALKKITGEDPVPKEQWGDIRAMTRTWIDWFGQDGNRYREIR